jgi:hypothetical protein
MDHAGHGFSQFADSNNVMTVPLEPLSWLERAVGYLLTRSLARIGGP